MRIQRLQALLASTLLASLGVAQSHVVVPPLFWWIDAPGTAAWMLTPFETRQQLLIDRMYLGAGADERLEAFVVRRNAADPDTFEAGAIDLKITLADGPEVRDAVTTFATNRLRRETVVFDGRLSLPRSTPPTQPWNWAAPDVVRVPFSTSFRCRGASLVIETESRVVVNGNSPEPVWWPVDAYRVNTRAETETFGTSCSPGLMGTPARGLTGSATPGGQVTMTLNSSSRLGGNVVGMIGFSNEQWGPLPLPADLGFVGAPGCELLVEPFFFLSTVLRPSPPAQLAEAQVSLEIPPSRDLENLEVFGQWMIDDPQHNAWGQTFSNGISWTLGRTDRFGTGVWLESTDLGSPTGRFVTDRFPVLRFDW